MRFHSPAPLSPAAAQEALSSVIDDTFNCISIDGHMSTNDTVLLVANGATGPLLQAADFATFQIALNEVAGELAQAIPADGEGATHLITIDVTGTKNSSSSSDIIALDYAIVS